MLNTYPLWKYLLLIVVLVLGIIYALPNLYGEDPAVQISHRTKLINESEVKHIKDTLTNLGITYKSIEQGPGHILIRFDNEEQQLKAASLIKDALRAEDTRYSVALNLAPATPQWLRSMNALPMYLGLDLRGGVHFLMEVDMDAAIKKSLERVSTELRGYLRENKVRYRTVTLQDDSLVVRFVSPEERDKALALLEEEFRDFLFDSYDDGRSYFLRMKYSEKALKEEKASAVKQNISTLKNRVNELGVAEPVIQQQGEDRVVVQLPGVQDTVRAKEILGATAAWCRAAWPSGAPLHPAARSRSVPSSTSRPMARRSCSSAASSSPATRLSVRLPASTASRVLRQCSSTWTVPAATPWPAPPRRTSRSSWRWCSSSTSR